MSIELSQNAISANDVNLAQEGAPLHYDLNSELEAIERGDLRSSTQIRKIYQMLAHAEDHQRAAAERLGLGLLVDGSPLKKTPELGLRVSEDLSTLQYFEVTEELSPEELNPTDREGRLFSADLGMELLMTVSNPHLLSPNTSYLKDVPLEMQDRIIQLAQSNQRLTYFGNIPTTWIAQTDNNAWSPNIDTVCFIKWLRDAGAFAGEISRSAEIGVGTGLISQALLSDNSDITRHLITDISPWAINASRRNILPFVASSQLDWYFGKGISGFQGEGPFDLIITNPPYIPHPDGESDVDHYRGTGLIKELFEIGPSILNRNNPKAAIYFQCSSLTLADIERYKKQFPDVELSQVAGPKRVPLRVWGMERNAQWLEFLKSNGMIEDAGLAQSTGIRYYHDIYAFKITAKK
jgi:hypothetical protein